jgi:hypothetical protein
MVRGLIEQRISLTSDGHDVIHVGGQGDAAVGLAYLTERVL